MSSYKLESNHCFIRRALEEDNSKNNRGFVLDPSLLRKAEECLTFLAHSEEEPLASENLNLLIDLIMKSNEVIPTLLDQGLTSTLISHFERSLDNFDKLAMVLLGCGYVALKSPDASKDFTNSDLPDSVIPLVSHENDNVALMSIYFISSVIENASPQDICFDIPQFMQDMLAVRNSSAFVDLYILRIIRRLVRLTNFEEYFDLYTHTVLDIAYSTSEPNLLITATLICMDMLKKDRNILQKLFESYLLDELKEKFENEDKSGLQSDFWGYFLILEIEILKISYKTVDWILTIGPDRYIRSIKYSEMATATQSTLLVTLLLQNKSLSVCNSIIKHDLFVDIFDSLYNHPYSFKNAFFQLTHAAVTSFPEITREAVLKSSYFDNCLICFEQLGELMTIGIETIDSLASENEIEGICQVMQSKGLFEVFINSCIESERVGVADRFQRYMST